MNMDLHIDSEWDSILSHTQRVFVQLESADTDDLYLLLSERQQMVKQYFERKNIDQWSNQSTNPINIDLLEEKIRQLQYQDQEILTGCKKQQQQILEQSRKFQQQQKSAGAYNAQSPQPIEGPSAYRRFLSQ